MTDDPLPSLSGLREGPPPPVAAVRDRVRRRRRARAVLAGGLATGATALLAVGLSRSLPGQRDRGFGVGPAGHVRLETVVEGPTGTRPLDGRPVHPDERLVFGVRSDGAVAVVLREVSAAGETVVWPASGTWWVEGEQWVGGDAPQAWRPDRAVREARYLLLACPDPGDLATGRGCARDEVVVRFDP